MESFKVIKYNKGQISTCARPCFVHTNREGVVLVSLSCQLDIAQSPLRGEVLVKELPRSSLFYGMSERKCLDY